MLYFIHRHSIIKYKFQKTKPQKLHQQIFIQLFLDHYCPFVLKNSDDSMNSRPLTNQVPRKYRFKRKHWPWLVGIQCVTIKYFLTRTDRSLVFFLFCSHLSAVPPRCGCTLNSRQGSSPGSRQHSSTSRQVVSGVTGT